MTGCFDIHVLHTQTTIYFTGAVVSLRQFYVEPLVLWESGNHPDNLFFYIQFAIESLSLSQLSLNGNSVQVTHKEYLTFLVSLGGN